jgi:hypothetical protein
METTRENITRFKEAEATRPEQSVPVRAERVNCVDTVAANGYLFLTSFGMTTLPYLSGLRGESALAELLKRRLEPLEIRVVKSNEPERQL